MFFVFGVSNKEKDLELNQTIICSNCGSYGRLKGFMTYTYFSLFFIPIFKWNKKYYIKSTCCGSLYSIDKKLGRLIELGEINNIKESDLTPIKVNYEKERLCLNCKYPLDSNFEYCPKCGSKTK